MKFLWWINIGSLCIYDFHDEVSIPSGFFLDIFVNVSIFHRFSILVCLSSSKSLRRDSPKIPNLHKVQKSEKLDWIAWVRVPIFSKIFKSIKYSNSECENREERNSLPTDDAIRHIIKPKFMLKYWEFLNDMKMKFISMKTGCSPNYIQVWIRNMYTRSDSPQMNGMKYIGAGNAWLNVLVCLNVKGFFNNTPLSTAQHSSVQLTAKKWKLK